MPSFVHQTLVELFRFRETLAVELVDRLCGVRLPRFSRVAFHETDLGEIVPTDRRADLVAVLEDENREPRAGIIVEVQLSRNPEKPFVWPLYQAGLRARLRCPCTLLVVTPSRSVARWADRPVQTGQPGAPFRPLVLGPARVPVIATLTQAQQNTELALLSVLAHGRTNQGPAMVDAAVGAAMELEGERSVLYFELLWRSASTALRRHLEDVMRVGKYEFQNEELGRLYQKCIEARQEGKLEGKLEGMREGKLEAVREIARKLLSRGQPAAEVAEVTGLTLEQVQQLAH